MAKPQAWAKLQAVAKLLNKVLVKLVLKATSLAKAASKKFPLLARVSRIVIGVTRVLQTMRTTKTTAKKKEKAKTRRMKMRMRRRPSTFGPSLSDLDV